jgi:DNA-binding transcriptional MerR regulator
MKPANPLKVGELAKRTGLTVRTLHHYDTIGLLSPSQRTPSGARCYGAQDLERLHRIQAMKQMGYTLPEIRGTLDDPNTDAKAILQRQVDILEQQMRQAQKLSKNLRLLLTQMNEGRHPDHADWLNALELMTLHQKHMNEDEIHQLRNPPHASAADIERDWAILVEEVKAAIAAGLQPGSEHANTLAWRWIRGVIVMTGNNPHLAVKLRQMQMAEPRAQAIVGITPQMFDWVSQAMALARVAVFAKYLTAEQTRLLKELQMKSMAEDMDRWPRLTAVASDLVAAGVPPQAPEAQELARRWVELGNETHHLGDPDMQGRIQNAIANEPELQLGVGITPQLLAFVRAAIGTYMANRKIPRPSTN